MRGLKILLTGSACTGKTTLGRALCDLYPQFSIPNEAVRSLCDSYQFDFANGNTGLQLAILHYETLLMFDENNYIGDGCILNSRAYTTYYRDHGKCDMDDSTYRFYCDASRDILRKNVDLIIFCRSGEIPIVEDGFRITDSQYIDEVDRINEELILKMGLKDKTIVPKGPVEERVAFCKPYIEKLLKSSGSISIS